MVGLLIRMKLTVVRHSMTGRRAGEMVLAALLGLTLAGFTIWLALHHFRLPLISTDLLAVALAVWALGWALGPVLFGGGVEALRPEHFSLLPIPPRRLATGLLGAAFVGIGPAVTLVALAAVVVHGARLGAGPALVAVLVLPLQLALFVLLSRVVTAVFGAALRTWFGSALAAAFSAGVMALFAAGWALSPAVVLVLYIGLPPGLHATALAVPSGWGLAAVDAAGRGDWGQAAGLVLALAAAGLLLLGIWSRFLVRGRSTRSQHHAGRARPPGPVRPPRVTGRVTATAVKELRTLSRDLLQVHYLFFALFYGVLVGVIPQLGADLPVQLPFIGATVVLAATLTVNVYGAGGTAIWLTLVTPGAARPDVRGRQLAWLLLLAPPAVVLSVVPTALSGQTWAWPWVLALVPALLGASAGVPLLLSVTDPVVLPDPKRRGDNLLAGGSNIGQAIYALLLVLLIAAPGAGLVLLGDLNDLPVLGWAGVVVGVLAGVGSAWGLGELAVRRLTDHGPELLTRLRGGPDPLGPAPRVATHPASGDRAAGDPTAGDPVAAGRRRPGAGLAWLLVFLCWIPIFPQGLVAMVFKLTGTSHRAWFLALYLPRPLQWPVLVLMVVLGLAMLLAVVPLYRYAVPPEQRRRPTGFARLLWRIAPGRDSWADRPAPSDQADPVRSGV